MRTMTFRTIPGITSGPRTADGGLLAIGVAAREGDVALPDATAFMLPAGMAAVDGIDPAIAIETSIHAGLPRIVTAEATLDDDGVWNAIRVVSLVDPRAVDVAAVLFDDAFDLTLRGLEIEDDRLEAHLRLTIPIEGMDETKAESAVALLDERVDPLDGLDDGDWKVDVLDRDEGPTVAWWIVNVEARSPAAIARLDAELARRTPWQRGAAA